MPWGEGWGKEIGREFGMDMYTLLHLKWMAIKVLLYSTWNSAVFCGSLDEFAGRKNLYMYMMAESL